MLVEYRNNFKYILDEEATNQIQFMVAAQVRLKLLSYTTQYSEPRMTNDYVVVIASVYKRFGNEEPLIMMEYEDFYIEIEKYKNDPEKRKALIVSIDPDILFRDVKGNDFRGETPFFQRAIGMMVNDVQQKIEEHDLN